MSDLNQIIALILLIWVGNLGLSISLHLESGPLSDLSAWQKFKMFAAALLIIPVPIIGQAGILFLILAAASPFLAAYRYLDEKWSRA